MDTYAFGVVAAFLLYGGNLPPVLRARPSSLAVDNDVFAQAKLKLPPEVSALLAATLCSDPAKRPSMSTVFDVIKRRLLFGKHKAFVSYNGKEWLIEAPDKAVNLTSSYGAASIFYDGLMFTTVNVSGEVYINNLAAHSGTFLPNSCVLTFGDITRGPYRDYVTIDLSHPEVVAN